MLFRMFSDTIQITVADAKPFTVSRTVVERVPFFRSCFRAPMQESITDAITLPDDDPRAIDDLLHYLYFGEGQIKGYFDEIESSINSEERTWAPEWAPLFELYVVAEKYQIEDLHNLLMDLF